MTAARRTSRRPRAERIGLPKATARPLLKGVDDGDPVVLRGDDIGQTGERWIEPFLEANRILLRRLEIVPEVSTRDGLHVRLKPGGRIGATALLSPSTRRVAAGLLISPRFRWSALGSVFERIGFSVEPALGGGPLVPGSAREVPPWLLAAPVLKRIEALLEHERRGFIEKSEERASPRGRINWTRWATHHVPSGRWTHFSCTFPDPAFDPELRAFARWTVHRVQEELALVADSPIGRALIDRASSLEQRLGPGIQRRPSVELLPSQSGFVAEAMEAMGWVADERGLGGARTLDGLAWDLPVDRVWEAWVQKFAADLARSCGLQAVPRVRERLRWQGSFESMGALVPDAELHGADRLVWLDAKYKAHLMLLARSGWAGVTQSIREAHRADLHQALAYAAIASVSRVDSILVYPHIVAEDDRPPVTVATLPAGRRRVRLVLAGLPFGFRGPSQRERTLQAWREILAG